MRVDSSTLDCPPDALAADILPQEAPVCVRVPALDMDDAPITPNPDSDSPAAQHLPATTQPTPVSDHVPRGLLLLNRIMGERASRHSWRGWPRRLWLASAALAGLSALAVLAAFLQHDDGTPAWSRSDFTSPGELYEDLAIQPLPETEPAAARKAPASRESVLTPVSAEQAKPAPEWSAAPASGSTTGKSGTVRAVGYQMFPSGRSRGAWLDGTIETEESSTPTAGRR